MKYKDKTKEQQIIKLAEPHQPIKELQARETGRRQADDALRKAYDEMDLRVKERTEDLVEANRQLLREIEERKKAEESLGEALKEVKQLKNQLRDENLYLREEINLIPHSHKDIVGNSEVIRTW